MPQSVINPTTHAKLIANLDDYCAVANIPKTMVYKSARDFCGEKELDWLIHYNKMVDLNMSLCLTGVHNPNAAMKMMAMTGALLRNFIDARVTPLNEVLDSCEKGQPVNPTVLMIPNLYLRSTGKTLPSWKVQLLFDLLLARYTANRLTVCYVEDVQAMTQEYGPMFTNQLQSVSIFSQGK